MQKLPKFPQEEFLAESLKNPVSLETYEKFLIGDQLKKLRKRAGWTQKDLASKLKTSQSAVARMEAGKQNVTVRVLVALALLFKKRLHIRFQ